MNTFIRNGAAALAVAIAVAPTVASCASTTPRAEQLAKYEAYAGAPVNKIRFFTPQGWEEVDDNHILITMRPTEVYLVRVSGPCLDYEHGAYGMLITNTAGWVQHKFDYVSFGNSQWRCRIEEMRPLDIGAMRAAVPTT